MNDMTAVIIPKSDQINADDLIAGPMTITIREVRIRGGQEQPVDIFFDGSDKPWRPCKSMSRVLVAAWGPDAKVYVGRSLTLYRDPSVKWGGMEVGGIRISHMSHINGKMVMSLTATKGQRKPHQVMPLVVQAKSQTQPAAPKRTFADVKADIEALADSAAVAVWMADNAKMKDSEHAKVRELYALAEARGKTLAAQAQVDPEWLVTEEEMDADDAKKRATELFPDDDFPGDRP